MSQKRVLSSILQAKRNQEKENDNAEVVVLITQKKFNSIRRLDYKYMSSIAEQLGWKIGRFQKAVDRVIQLLKAEKETKEKQNDRRKDKENKSKESPTSTSNSSKGHVLQPDSGRRLHKLSRSQAK